MARNKLTIEEVLKLTQEIKEWKFHPLPWDKDEITLQGENGTAIITIGTDYTMLVDDHEKNIWATYYDDPRIKELYEKIRGQHIK